MLSMSIRQSCKWLMLSVWLAGVQLPMGTGNIHGPGTGRADLGQCAGPRVRQGSPESVLPRPTPLTATSLPPVMQAYQAGLQQCNKKFDQLREEYERKVNSTKPVVETDDDAVTTYPELLQCRGNAAFFAATGLVLWPFGPERCEVGSECWTGVLACGEPREDIRQQAQWDGAESSYRGWSLGSVHIHTVVQGRHGEVVAPDMQLSTGPAANGGQPAEFILWRFVLTTTGPFDVEMRLEGWYPGRLHRPLESNQTSSRDLSNFQYFGATSYRCPANTRCSVNLYIPQCEKWSYLPQTPRKLESVDTGACPPRSEELPVCHSGDNDGRYLILPPIARQLCKSREYTNRLVQRVRLLHAERRSKEMAKLLSQYYGMVNALDAHVLWKEILREHNWDTMDPHSRRYLQVLKHYAHGNPCMLVDIQDAANIQQQDNLNIAIYAPYACRYHLYNTAESRSCAVAKGTNKLVFHGDSMSRDLFAMTRNQFAESQISLKELKHKLEVKNEEASYNSSSIYLAELFDWGWNPDLIARTEAVVPDVYVTNYALAHMCSDAIEKFEKQVDRLLVSYWATREAAHPRLKIFQSAKDNHGRRLEYFIGERIRQSNAVLRRALVGKFGFQELDEWLLTAPMLERGGDGWHFAGTVRRMESLILVNMICNA